VPEDWSTLVEKATRLPEQPPPPTRQQQMAQQQQDGDDTTALPRSPITVRPEGGVPPHCPAINML